MKRTIILIIIVALFGCTEKIEITQKTKIIDCNQIKIITCINKDYFMFLYSNNIIYNNEIIVNLQQLDSARTSEYKQAEINLKLLDK